MESVTRIRRRTNEFIQNLPPLPNMKMPHVQFPNVQLPNVQLPKNVQFPNVQLPKFAQRGAAAKSAAPAAMKGTWEHISLPSLPRTSHSLDVIGGTAYLFGGESLPGVAVDNNMHVISLPSSGAGADYYPVKAKPSPKTQLEEAKPSDETMGDVPLDEPSSAASKGKSVELSDVPSSRLGHSTAVIGTRIFMFGGRTSGEEEPLDENGRVWIFETKTQTWTFLDPYKDSPVPPPRIDAAAVASDKPSDFNMKPLRRTSTWREWAEGDSAEVGIPQRPIPGSVAATAHDEEEAGYGTFIVHGGLQSVDDEAFADVWAFDVHSYTWKELPSAPGPARSGAALALAKSRLYRFGGHDEDGAAVGTEQLDVLELSLDQFNDVAAKGEIGIFARGEWQTITPAPAATPPTPRTATPQQPVTPESSTSPAQPAKTPESSESKKKDDDDDDDEESDEDEESQAIPTTASAAAAETTPEKKEPGDDQPKTEAVEAETVAETAPIVTESPKSPLPTIEEEEPWPKARGHATMTLVQGGGGREYLIMMFGSGDEDEDDEEKETEYKSDVWAFQVPPQGMTSASFADAFLMAVGRKTGEGKWRELSMGLFDDGSETPEEQARRRIVMGAGKAGGPLGRARTASAALKDLDDAGVLVLGGEGYMGGEGEGDKKKRKRVFGDAWIFRFA